LQVRRGQKPDVAMAAESLAHLAEYGTKRNIVINLENDERVAEDPFRIVEVIEKVNSPYLRALPDFGNTLIGHDAEYSQKGVKGMLEHAWNMCHVKDVVQADDGSLVKVDLAAMFALAKQSSYRGFYSMEFDTDAGDPITGTQKLVQETLHYLS
jgi:sugar phosphate isomerase/epimerase